MTIELEQAKDTIRKLLNLAADDGAAEGEVDNALRFADRLMRAHHLSEDDIGEDDPHVDAAREESWEFGEGEAWSTGQSFCSWEHQLAHFVNDLIGSTKYYYNPSKIQRKDGRIIFDDGGRATVKGSPSHPGIGMPPCFTVIVSGLGCRLGSYHEGM